MAIVQFYTPRDELWRFIRLTALNSGKSPGFCQRPAYPHSFLGRLDFETDLPPEPRGSASFIKEVTSFWGRNCQFPVRLSKSPPRKTLILVDFKGDFRYDLSLFNKVVVSNA